METPRDPCFSLEAPPHSPPGSLLYFFLIHATRKLVHVCTHMHTRLSQMHLLSVSPCQKVSSTRSGIFLFVRCAFPGFMRA